MPYTPTIYKEGMRQVIEERLLRMMSKSSGKEFSVLSIKPLRRDRTTGNMALHVRRAYMIASLRGPDETTIEVFIKQAPDKAVAPLDKSLAEAEMTYCRSPRFFGSFLIRDLKFGVWENVPAASFKRFTELAPEKLETIVTAIAEMNTYPRVNPNSRIAQACNRRMPWISIPDDWFLRHMKAEGSEWDHLRNETIRLLKRRPRIMRRLLREGDGYLSHNDISPGNVLLPPDGGVVFVDWLSACLSLPGIDLWFLHDLEESHRCALFQRYADATAELGHPISVDHARYVSAMMHAFLLLTRGCKRLSPRRIQAAVDLANSIENP